MRGLHRRQLEEPRWGWVYRMAWAALLVVLPLLLVLWVVDALQRAVRAHTDRLVTRSRRGSGPQPPPAA
jgi:hypothetical protein